jgi:hypothetical protein
MALAYWPSPPEPTAQGLVWLVLGLVTWRPVAGKLLQLSQRLNQG